MEKQKTEIEDTEDRTFSHASNLIVLRIKVTKMG